MRPATPSKIVDDPADAERRTMNRRYDQYRRVYPALKSIYDRDAAPGDKARPKTLMCRSEGM
jgi:hypothetical protein